MREFEGIWSFGERWLESRSIIMVDSVNGLIIRCTIGAN
jgi:hypothetical protein